MMEIAFLMLSLLYHNGKWKMLFIKETQQNQSGLPNQKNGKALDSLWSYLTDKY